MAAKFDRFDVVLLNGPPFAGKSIFCNEELLKTHETVDPHAIFAQNPNYGLRDIGLQILQVLKKKKKVAVDDENANGKTRNSYIKLIKKKFPLASVCIVELLPVFGCQQLYWTREFAAAEHASCQSGIHSRSDGYDDFAFRDTAINMWFASETDTEVTYRPGIVDKPVQERDVAVYQRKQPFKTHSAYKFEVPALFVQWELMSEQMHDGKLVTGKVVKMLSHWSSKHQCGRVIIVCDGASIKTGEKTRSQLQTEIQSLMPQLTKKFIKCPVYVMMVGSPGSAGGFVLPPKPGLLAFLQKRHCLNLHSKNTLYVYESHSHMKMAEGAGIRHIKGIRVLDHPSQVVSHHHAATVPPIPDMLNQLEVIENTDTSKSKVKSATIPLYHLKKQFNNGCVVDHLLYGRREFMFATDWDIVERYQNLYTSQASKVNDPVSHIDNITDDVSSSPADLDSSLQPQHNISLNISHTRSRSHDLPKWMLGKSESGSLKSSLESSRSDSTASHNVRIRKTVYVMTERELTEVAVDILKQAGKEDLVKQISAETATKTTNLMHSEKVKTPNKRPTCTKLSEKPLTPEDTSYQEIETKYGKIENPEDNRDLKLVEQQETVADVLGDFSCKATKRHPSPQKRSRPKSQSADYIAIRHPFGTDDIFVSELLDSTFKDREHIIDETSTSPRKRSRPSRKAPEILKKTDDGVTQEKKEVDLFHDLHDKDRLPIGNRKLNPSESSTHTNRDKASVHSPT